MPARAPEPLRLPALPVRLGPFTLHNPVMPASGTYDWTGDGDHPIDAHSLGAVVLKTVTLDERVGNPPPRLHEIPGGLLNSIGIPSAGLERFLTERRPQLGSLRTIRIVSVAGTTPAQYVAACALLDREADVDAIELNLSCPNLETDSVFATDPAQLSAIVAATRGTTSKPLIAKLSPNVPDIRGLVEIAEAAGADMLCIANTFTGMSIDVETASPILGNRIGGVSSPALLPIVLKHVWDARTVTALPIVASGGIYRADDAIQYLMAGATAVQVGTANFFDPTAMYQVAVGIQEHLARHRLHRVDDLIGRANPSSRPRPAKPPPATGAPRRSPQP